MAATTFSTTHDVTPIARVAELHGEAFAKGKDGSLRPLHLGDPIYESDVLVTADGARLEIASIDGHSLVIGGNETLTVDAEVMAAAPPDAVDAALHVDQTDVSRVIQAINEGGNLDQLLEETAAGNSAVGTDGGPTFVRLLRIAEGVDPLNYQFETSRSGVTDDPLSTGNTATKLTVDANGIPGGGGADSGGGSGDASGGGTASTPPSAAADAVTTSEDTPLDFDPRGNDSNPTATPLTISHIAGQPISAGNPVAIPQGTVSLNPDGSLHFVPKANVHGNDSFTYTIDDGHGGSSTATVSLTIAPVIDLLAGDDSNTGLEDAVINGSVVANDSTTSGGALSYIKASDPAHGSVVVDANGDYHYTPAANYHGADSFTYTVTDAVAGESLTRTVSLTVTPVNDPPIAVNDSIATVENAPVTVAVLSNDSDIDGDPLTVASVTQGANGSVVIDPLSGNPIYTPNRGYHGNDSFTYTIDDGHGGSSTATVNVVVGSVNDAPVAQPDSNTTLEDTPLSSTLPLQANDTDADGDSLSVLAGTFTTTQGGSIIIAADGNYTYTPPANFHGIDTVDYTVTDGSASDVGTLTLTVTPVNDAPAAIDDALTTAEDAALTITPSTLLANDSDIDGDPLTITSVQGATHGTVALVGGNVVFTPDADYHGPANFTYTISDGQGGTSTATVNIDVTPVNDPPLAMDDSASTREDTPVTIAVRGNDSDPDGDSLIVSAVTQGGHGSVTIDPVSGNPVYTPNANYHGNDSFTYTVRDVDGATSSATVNIVVGSVPDLTAADDASSGPMNNVINGSVIANDSTTSGGALSFAKASDPSHGTVVVDADGNYHYTPGRDFAGTDSFTYTVTDAASGEALTQTVSLTVTKAGAHIAVTSIAGDNVLDSSEAISTVAIVGLVGGDAVAGDVVSTTINGHSYSGTVAADGVSYSITGVSGADLLAAAGNPVRVSLVAHDELGNPFTVHAEHDYSTATALNSTTSAVAPATAGLHAEYYGYNDGTNPAYKTHTDDQAYKNLDSIADMQAIINGRNGGNTVVGSIVAAGADVPDAVFQATAINYGYINGSLGTNTSGTHKLNEFLHATDAATLVGTVGQTTDAGIRFIGYLDSPAGSYDIRIHSDDGFRLMIDGTSVADFNGIRSPGNSFVTNVTLHGGLSPIEILYWDQAGEAVLHIEFKPAGAPDSAYADLGTGDLALVSPDFTQVLTPLQDIIADPAHTGQYLIRTGQEYTGTHGVDHITGGDGRDSIHGGAGNDIIDGGANDDQIDGGAGHDHLTGGLGSDVFVWHLGDQGTQGNPAIDTISDFSVSTASGSKDVLDLRDLLQGENHATGTDNLSDYLHFEKSGADTIVHVSSTGGFATDSHAVGGVFSSGHEDQSIILHNADLVGTSTADQQIIQDLLTNGKLLTH